MEAYTNHAFLDRRGKHARWGSYIGLGALVIGLFVAFRSPLASYLLLVVGLIGASYGSYMANRYVREPRADQVIDQAMEPLDKRYVVYHYYLSSHHVVASHYGLTVIVPRTQAGLITYADGRWRHRAGLRRLMQLFGEPSMGKPEQDLAVETRWIREWVNEVLPEAEVPVSGLVLFTNPRAELHARDAPVPTMTADRLADYLKQGLKGSPVLSTARQKELRRVLDEVVGE